MAKGGLDFGNEGSTDNVVALNPIVGLAREDLMGAVAVMLRETAGRPVTAVKHMRAFTEDVVKIVTLKSDLAPDPKDLKPDAEGLLKWTLDLKPGEKREITLKFSIDHPADINVSGLQ